MGPLSNYFFLLIASYILATGKCQEIFDVTKYGAVGNGASDDSEAFLKAWQALCETTGSGQTLIIPKGKTFFLQPVRFQGPCKSNNVSVQVLGNIVAPRTIGAWSSCISNSWLFFSNVSGLSIEGSGIIDGQGSVWWSEKVANNEAKCSDRPTVLHVHGCNDFQLSGLHFVNSPKNHISINGCSGVSISGININSPIDSPNTDGIDISSSQHINIHDSFIASGDDCIAINTGSIDINITHIMCGPGHGISVGSLGKDGENAIVEQVHVSNCTFNGTQNGARIKTWPGGSGYARHISFEQITLMNAQNPIIIDQHYCNGAHGCTGKEPTAVAISDVTFRGFVGTCASKAVITLDCDNNSSCNDIVMENVNITSLDPGKKINVICNNAHGKAIFNTLQIPCLSR